MNEYYLNLTKPCIGKYFYLTYAGNDYLINEVGERGSLFASYTVYRYSYVNDTYTRIGAIAMTLEELNRTLTTDINQNSEAGTI